MGTRGAYGFHIEGQDKVTYNHFDSYPDYLGKHIVKYITKRTPAQLQTVAKRIVLVGEQSEPTQEQVQRWQKHADRGVSTGALDEWYVLLRNTQGDLSVYDDPNLTEMIDNQGFLGDSLFCEYAYIINLDTDRLEFYRGFNQDSAAKGRYANIVHDADEQAQIHEKPYAGVVLLAEFALDDVVDDPDRIVDEMERLMSNE